MKDKQAERAIKLLEKSVKEGVWKDEPKSAWEKKFYTKVGEFFPLDRDLNAFIDKINPVISSILKAQRQELKKELLAKGSGGGNWRRVITEVFDNPLEE